MLIKLIERSLVYPRPSRERGDWRPRWLRPQNVWFRSADNTSEFNNFNFRWSPWVTPAGIKEFGMMAICSPDHAACNDAAALYRRADTKVIPVTLQRDVWGAKGLPWTMNIYIIPPLAER